MAPKKLDKQNSKTKELDGDAEKVKVTKLIEELAERAPEALRPHLKQAAPTLAIIWINFLVALPYILKGIAAVHEFISKLPEKVLYAGIGALVCFFGGIFPATIAAAEAWMLCGGTEAWGFCKELYGEFAKVQAASKKDDDAPGDGKDLAQLEPKDLVARKVALVVKTVDPERVSGAVVGLYTGWVGVLAILKIEFAKTVTLGEAIGKQICKPLAYLEPKITEQVPEEYKKWVPIALRWFVKGTAISLAWFVQRFISCLHSAIRGGHLFGKYLVDYLHETGKLEKSSENSNIDEMAGWGIAAVGVLFQIMMGFGVPFFLVPFLWPVRLLEAFIVWSVAA